MANVVNSGQTDAIYGSWIFDLKWDETVLTFGFPDSAADFGYTSDTTISSLNGLQKSAARGALAEVESFTGLTFQEVAGQSDADATLRFAADSAVATAVAYYPLPVEQGGDSFFGDDTRYAYIGTWAGFTFLHEAGHMLGLEHGHEAVDFAGTQYDSIEYTVMTYSTYVGDVTDGYDAGSVDYPQSYMMLDIAALQFLYGANYASAGEVWSGDTTYAFDPGTGEMFINGVGQGAPDGNRIFRTIWDGDGVDTYDLSNYTTRMTIDLRPGAWSTFSTEQLADLDVFSSDPDHIADGNLANALLFEDDPRGLIENAIGGTKGDRITGNQADNVLEGRGGYDVILGEAGDDLIYGGQHDDRLHGGDDDDVLSGGNGNDTLWGDDGDDRLKGQNGDDDLRGGRGADVLIGGTGRDLLRGHAGADSFVFLSVADSQVGSSYDRILDFATGVDVLDLTSLGTGLTLVIDGGLHGGAPTVATRESNGNTVVSVDIDGDGAADMKILALGSLGLTAVDFLI